ncbi:hypothetical protein [Porticoccus sp.]
MMQRTVIPFGEWLPDQPALGNAVTVVKNCIPNEKSYRSINALLGVSNALNSACLGAAWALSSAQTYFNFAGDAGKLYKLTGTTFADVSKSGGYAATNWEYVIWADRVIAVDINTPTQYYDMGTSTLFADLAGSPPKAKHIAVVGDFIVMGNLSEGGTPYPNRVRWSGYNNSETWTSSLATQSDYQDLLGRGGAIQRIVPGATGLIFQEHAIRRMIPTSPPLVFKIQVEERDRGCYAPNSVVWIGDMVFFYSHDGFYVKQGMDISKSIGSEKIDRFIRSDLDTTDITKMRGAVDRRNKLVAWCYPSLSTGANRVLFYRWDTGKWSVVDQSAQLLMEHVSASYTLDDLDTIFTTGIDTSSIPVDAETFRGGVLSLGAFNASNILSTFSGSPLKAEIETGEMNTPTGRRQSVKSIRPLTDGTTTVFVGTRDNQNDNFSYGPGVTVNVKGEIDARSSARYHRFKACIEGGFNHAQGLEVQFREEGTR